MSTHIEILLPNGLDEAIKTARRGLGEDGADVGRLAAMARDAHHDPGLFAEPTGCVPVGTRPPGWRIIQRVYGTSTHTGWWAETEAGAWRVALDAARREDEKP